ncbi:TetR/AcrR family transcriptional regulator [Streptomyces sp. NPDC002812]|uniref:TetR/AcrR family transcriptional regulator n=1 Tax=Streptomyces sp. NPDC002812 TaxID=3154434 RepID=UPI00332CA55D
MPGRERITAAAVRLLDAEGPARFSMRRLAAGLGVSAMSLYWYVDTKHDLLELALDSALGELGERQEPAGPPAEGWPGRLRSPARGYRRLLVDHPWVAPLTAAYPNIGPHARVFDSTLHRLLDATGLPDATRAGARLAVSQFPARLWGHGPAAARRGVRPRARRPDRRDPGPHRARGGRRARRARSPGDRPATPPRRPPARGPPAST